MSTSINDSESVRAILDRLRASHAWQTANNQSTAVEAQSDSDSAVSNLPSVASLLSQLNNSGVQSEPTPRPAPIEPSPPPIPVQTTPETDLRHLTFQQALPRLAQLSDDPKILSAIENLQQEQNKLERDLWSERVSIRSKYESKVQVAKTKAQLIGANGGVSKHEAEMISRAYEKELKQFDSDRALPAWDALVAKQQTTLAQLGLPSMFLTTEKSDRERQHRIIQVVEGIVSSKE
ncbi:hypothetical protein MIND_00724400 [Mycena indigotica]|uniref:Uncharacterized protein n=1 Tax=Mycena indigotica TaxID=2126181 RepID=A0A8H6W120_9AGAR|nr:uncharacterized protein MIND_00724400 [Mycena indigotica]KAF7301589.1 hypothetical protein MIND_00724400 [Mycena indigotica]